MTARCAACRRRLTVPSPDGMGPACRRKFAPASPRPAGEEPRPALDHDGLAEAGHTCIPIQLALEGDPT